MKKMRDLSPPVILTAVFILALMPFALVELFHSFFYHTIGIGPYLVFHNITEFFSVMVSLSIFGVGWFTFDQSKNRQALFISCAFLAVGLIDFMHTLSFPGEPDFITPSSTAKGIQFWLFARFITAAALLASAFIYPDTRNRWLSRKVLLPVTLVVTALVFAVVIYFPEKLPAVFVEGVGLTRFKIAAEYVINGIFILAFIAYWRRLVKTGDRVLVYYLSAFIICIFSELSFTLYKSAYDSYNFLGHIYKLFAFVLIYLGIFSVSVKFPYREVVSKSAELQSEVERRKKAETDLAGLNRTLKMLSAVNQSLIRINNETELLNEACKIVVELGGYRMAWIAFEGNEEPPTWLDAAHSGFESGYIAEAILGDDGKGFEPGRTAVRTGEPARVQNVESDPDFAPWREESLRRGYQSVISLPLISEERPFGVLSIYAGEPQAFNDKETEVLKELASDLSFGITAQRVQVKRKRLEQQLIESQRLEGIGKLAGGVAHDFNNYLTAICGYIDLACQDTPPDSPAAENLMEAKASSDRAANLARQLLLFGRGESMQKEEVNLNHIVGDLSKMLTSLIGEQFNLEIELQEPLWTIDADPGHLEQVLMNLVVNARDAMFKGGTIKVGTRNVEYDPEFAKTKGARVQRRFVELSVADEGAGMDAETLSHIFEPFFSTKGLKGTGLGLSVVYGIVTQHGGWIDVESEPGRGSTFKTLFPAKEEQN